MVILQDVITFGEGTDQSLPFFLGLGNGRWNTQTIVKHLATTGETGTAAQLCANKTVTVGGKVFDDWFLPCIGELVKIGSAVKKGVTGLPTTGVYWSSTQYSNNQAWSLWYYSGVTSSTYALGKDTSRDEEDGYQEGVVNRRYVRAIRAF